MNCDKVRSLLSSYTDGQLSERRQKRVEEHLKECEACRKELFDLRQSVVALNDVNYADPGQPFNDETARRWDAARGKAERVTTFRYRFALGFACVLIAVILAVPVYVANLANMVDRQGIYVIGQESLIPGSMASIRVVVANQGVENPMKDARVQLQLARRGGWGKIPLASGTTDAAGTLNTSFQVPENLSGDYNLIARADSSAGSDSVLFPVSLQRVVKVMLTTDKPIYQPGQVIHIRTLSLLRPTLKPAEGDKIVLTIEDPKGNKVFQKSFTCSKWGIAATDFQLGEVVNSGAYTVKAALGETETEKTVTVKRYVLPKFKVTVETDRTYYLPGQTIRGTVTARYFFGKPVASGRVKVDLSALAVHYDSFAQISGATDDEGTFTFEARAPRFIAGQPVAAGSGLMKVGASVTDGASHTEASAASVPIAKAPIRIAVVPESGQFVSELENVVYVVTSYPDGRPAQTQTTMNINGRAFSTRSDRLGISTYRVTPPEKDLVLGVSARDAAGMAASERFNIPLPQPFPGYDEYNYGYYRSESTNIKSPQALDRVILRTDRAIYNVGDTADIVVLTTKQSGAIYLDAVLDGQTVLTRTVYLQNGRAELSLDLADDHAGTLTFSAYTLSPVGAPVRDTATVFVKAANGLSVAVTPDKSVYRPGENARIDFQVMDQTGAAVPSAIGVNIVDESVFSVQEQAPGLEALYFALQEDILKPRYQTKMFKEDADELSDLTDEERNMRWQQELLEPELQVRGKLPSWGEPGLLASGERDATIQRAAKALFASAVYVGGANVEAVTDSGKRLAAQDAHRRFHSSDARPVVAIAAAYLVFVILLLRYAYRRRLRFEMALIVASLLALAVFVVSAMIGSLQPVGAVAGANDVVHGVSGWAWSILSLGLVVLLAWPTRILTNGPVMAFGLLVVTSLLAVSFLGESANTRFGDSQMALDGGGDGPMSKGGDVDGGLALAPMAATPQPTTSPMTRSSGRDAQPVTVRQFFPETLYFNPAVITDESGRGFINLKMADSITTWRLSALASSLNGQIGSSSHGLKVFQDFFIDLDLPLGVTSGDSISVPVAVYNYLPEAQSVAVTMRQEKWFTPGGPATKTLQLAANGVGVVYFPIKAADLGRHSLTVEGRSGSLSDAVRRDLTVYPNGQQQTAVSNGVVWSGRTGSTVNIPPYAIPGATTLLVKVSPGVIGQVVDGLEALLQVPYGCFEQTSSVTYPNVLVLKYLKATKKDKPQIAMKAEQFINVGYQRLLTFEVRGGGFDWYGEAPANTVLTAYGVMELADMAEVSTVDQRIIERAKRLLESRQQADGSWGLDERTHDWSSLDSRVAVTAYVAWALAEGGFEDRSAVNAACEYLNSHIAGTRDPYTLALVANALASADKPGAEQALDKLAKSARVRDGRASWSSGASTLTYGQGSVAGTETTALAANAFIKSHTHSDLATQALAELAATKDASGSWGTTQATILALKALLAGSTEGIGGTGQVSVRVNGQQAGTLNFTEEDMDVTHIVDASRLARGGANRIEIAVDGRARPAYQVVATYYVPWSRVTRTDSGGLNIDVHYGKLQVAKNGTVNVTASVKTTGKTVKMAIVDLGTAPGFAVVTEDLDGLVARKRIDRYEVTHRQVILYLRNIRPQHPVRISYRLRALYPVKAVTPPSRAYDYYNPASVKSIAKPVRVEII